MQETTIRLSMRAKLCARPCICIGAVRYRRQELFVRISRENFTAAAALVRVMSYRFRFVRVHAAVFSLVGSVTGGFSASSPPRFLFFF